MKKFYRKSGRQEDRLLAFAKQTETCHAELVSASCNRHGDKTLKRVQGDKAAFTLAEVLFHPAEQSKRIAFTLAEVLITLGIIGVVAALTMPSLIQNFKKQQTITGLKKAYTVINQAMKLSEVDNGSYDTWELGKSIGATAYNEKYWLPYFKGAYICDTPQKCGYKSNTPFKDINGNPYGTTLTASSSRVPFMTADGIMYLISVMAGAQNAPDTKIYIDINGSKAPNQYGVDVFIFERLNKGILPHGYDATVEEIKNGCKLGGDNTFWFCAAKIMTDGWQIKDDYPAKF